MTGNRKFFLLLALVSVGCGGGPTEPPKPPPPPPVAVDVTVSVVMPYPKEGGPAVEGATVTCLKGCREPQVRMTNNLGYTTFVEVRTPLVLRFEKPGYITREVKEIYTGDSVVISHVWPEEGEKILQLLEIHEEIILHWGEEVVLARDGVAGRFSYPIVIVRDIPGLRWLMLHILAHELYHAHQFYHAGRSDNESDWKRSPEGGAYAVALEADRAAERLFPPIDGRPRWQSLKENSAEFFAWWFGKGKDDTERANLCKIAVARCQVMEDFYGPRP